MMLYHGIAKQSDVVDILFYSIYNKEASKLNNVLNSSSFLLYVSFLTFVGFF